ncbi:hypothetical protein K450DRAFT_237864 [Umbelopsis ramanniana AG]|uniref:Uncharacterized protein n=1 Tax=Umbelopsis ramanniana AG TaxID=1314678 RepID=A0AAD5EBR9_UMBRA|nr:uncharacterized protein K450DRAFT_237864 [Umbelopsis ramanniana AG]KAI8580309.1 hypothetical protein K450DRAFT_237864 [Umbelopsis ramanniana AG]
MRKRLDQISLLGLALASLLGSVASSVDTSHIPGLDLSAFQQLGIVGDFAGLSRFSNPHQFESLYVNSATILSKSSNDTFESIISTPGTLNAACKLPQGGTNNAYDVYFAGSFTTINNTVTNNIAKLDTQTGNIVSLQSGLDGPVYALYCDPASSTVYVGGAFNTSVMMWRSGTWTPMPWKALDGPVYSITPNPVTNTIFFAGQFQSTMDGVYGNTTISQPVPLSPPSSVGSGNTASNPTRNDPTSITCPTSTSNVHNHTWLLEDDTPGYWEANFGETVTPQTFRLANTFYDGRGTDNFGVLALGSNTYYELSYTDPATQQTVTCTQNCSLSHNKSISYQDFQVVNSFPTQGLRIEIFSWFGCGGGLSFVEIFTSDNILHASNGASSSNCSDTPQGVTVTTGNWKECFVQGSYQYALTSTFPASELTTANASILFQPYVSSMGLYQLFVTTPGCVGTSTCGQRTQVDLTLTLSPGNTSVVTLDQNNTADARQMIYSGMISPTSDLFRPSILLSVAKNAVAPTGGTVSIVADSIEVVKNSTGSTLVSILEFSMANYTSNTTSYKPLANQLAAGSIVRAMYASQGDLYIGGTLSQNGSNLVKYQYATAQYSNLGNIQSNNSISSLVVSGSSLFAGGNFTTVANGTTPAINYFGKYDLQGNTWSAVPPGVNGPVTALTLSGDNQTLSVSGQFRDVTTNAVQYDNMHFNITSGTWFEPSYLLLGSIIDGLSKSDSDIYLGNFLGAQSIQTSDYAALATNGTITASPSNLFANSNAVVNTGVIWDQGSGEVIAAGGSFSLNGSIQNVALLSNGAWKAINVPIQGQVLSLAAMNDLLFIGGTFNASLSSGSSSSFLVYNVAQQKAVATGGFSVSNGDTPAVNVIKVNPTDNNTIVAAGRFDTAGSLGCVNICSWNVQAAQWQSLGSGVQGKISDFTYYNSNWIAVGNLTLNGVAVYATSFDSGSQVWSPFNASLPGPATTVFVNDVANQIFFAGQKSDLSSYICVYSNNNLTVFDTQLGPSTQIHQIFAVPMQSPNDQSFLSASQTMLMVNGQLELVGFGNVSSALFDGATWYPTILSTTQTGKPGTIKQIFYKAQSINYTTTHHTPAPLVILVAIAGSLGLIFVGVGAGMGVLYFRQQGIF